jgi:YD repeat-containing protein
MATSFAVAPVSRSILSLVLLVIGLTTDAGAAPQPSVFYVYDELNRLIGVIDQDGNTASYTYDAVGNILRIERLDAAGSHVAITLVSPARGKAGTSVQVFGRGFADSPGQNSVAFNGVAATVTAASPNRIVTSVPPGASSGLITIFTVLGSATSPTIFVVPGAITVSPSTASVVTQRTRQFTATEAGGAVASVTWSVNDVLGGNAALGTISPDGLYTAPAIVPTPPVVTVAATNRDDVSLVGSAEVAILAPAEALLVGLSLSVGVRASPETLLAAPAVSLQADAASGTVATSTTSVSLHVDSADRLVSARPASLAVAPVVTSVAPASGSRGATALTITITGADLVDATTLGFRLSGAADASITVTDLAAHAGGTSATATIAIAPGAVPGPRTVTISTPAGISTPVPTGGNVFTVQ